MEKLQDMRTCYKILNLFLWPFRALQSDLSDKTGRKLVYAQICPSKGTLEYNAYSHANAGHLSARRWAILFDFILCIISANSGSGLAREWARECVLFFLTCSRSLLCSLWIQLPSISMWWIINAQAWRSMLGNGTNYRSVQVFLRTIINACQLGINEWISS